MRHGSRVSLLKKYSSSRMRTIRTGTTNRKKINNPSLREWSVVEKIMFESQTLQYNLYLLALVAIKLNIVHPIIKD